MMKKLFIIHIVICAFSFSVSADDGTSAVRSDTGSAYSDAEPRITSLGDMLTLRTFVRLPIMPISIKPDVGEDETAAQEKARESAHLHYLPNLPLVVGAGFNWKWLGGSYAHQAANFGNTGREGRTVSNDVRFYIFKRKFTCDLIYQNYKGFHLALPSDQHVAARSVYAKRTDMRYVLYEMNIFYIFSDDFSMQAAFEQTERQEHWDWSFMGMISAVQYSLEDSISLIPPASESAFLDNTGFRKGVFRGIAAGPGFGLTIPVKKYFITAAAFFGSGYMNRRYEVSDGNVRKHDGFYRINVKASAGYNGDAFFAGNSFIYNGTGNYSGLRIVNNTYTAELYAGVRL